jgi:hypothetical protein
MELSELAVDAVGSALPGTPEGLSAPATISMYARKHLGNDDVG